MADISLPSDLFPPKTFTFGLLSNTQIASSPLTGAIRSRGIPGSRWVARLQWDDMSPDVSAIVEAFLVQLRGQENRLLLHNLGRPTPRGSAAGTPLVNGAGQTGNVLITDGWTSSQTGVLLRGDMIGVNGMLLMVTADANSNGSGQATLTVEPPMWNVPPDNAAITTTKPVGRFISVNNRVDWSNNIGTFIGQHALELAETLTT